MTMVVLAATNDINRSNREYDKGHIAGAICDIMSFAIVNAT